MHVLAGRRDQAGEAGLQPAFDVVDVNPNCDLSRTAGMARAAAAVGMDYGSLVRLLVRYALRRKKTADASSHEDSMEHAGGEGRTH